MGTDVGGKGYSTEAFKLQQCTGRTTRAAIGIAYTLPACFTTGINRRRQANQSSCCGGTKPGAGIPLDQTMLNATSDSFPHSELLYLLEGGS